MSPLRRLLLGALLLLAPGQAGAAAPSAGDCSGSGGVGPSHCLYRSLLPSTGIVADCKSDTDCRIGYYYGGPDRYWRHHRHKRHRHERYDGWRDGDDD